MEKRFRSIAKAISWRIVGTIVLASVSYFITGSIKLMTMITILFECIQLVNYYWHERLWMKIKWGKIPHPLQNLPVKRRLKPEHMRQLEAQLQAWGYFDGNDESNGKTRIKKNRRLRPVKPLPLGVSLKKETA